MIRNIELWTLNPSKLESNTFLVFKDWISFWVHLLDHERNGQTGKFMKRASASWVICQFEHCVHDPINAPRMKFNPYIYIL